MCPALLLNLAAWIALGQQDSAKPRPEVKTSPASSKAIQDFKRDASDYVVRLENRPSGELTLRNEPLLHWGNPARYGEDGAVFVWMLDGRPEVVGSVFTFRQGDLIPPKARISFSGRRPAFGRISRPAGLGAANRRGRLSNDRRRSEARRRAAPAVVANENARRRFLRQHGGVQRATLRVATAAPAVVAL